MSHEPDRASRPFAALPRPPYYAVIFSSQRTSGDDGYGAMAARMVELAARQPGFLGVESARDEKGFGITVSYWASEEAIAAWQRDAEHLEAQRGGRERWYEHFELRVARVERARGFDAAPRRERRSELVRAQLVLPVRDLPAARAWYERTLGFATTYVHSDPVEDPSGNYAILRRDGAELHLLLEEPPCEHAWSAAGTGYLFLLVREVEAVLRAAEASGAALRRGLARESWGARAFLLEDPSGNLVRVAEVLDGGS